MTTGDELPGLAPEAEGDQVAAQEHETYRERLRQALRDPAFRRIEGFPIAEDEDILALSDPPYYTACPNPFVAEILETWQAERAGLRQELGLPDDQDDNGDGGPAIYQREPFAADVSEGKNDAIYNAHSYHTKVPHKAVMRYILHYTDPGDIVFDGFCGTGMTGVAGQLCADRRAVEELGYRIDADGVVFDGDKAMSRLGGRKVVLVDLSPAATFIAYNYNAPVDAATFERQARRILREVEHECGWMYETWHPHCEAPNRVKGRINYTVWSDVFVCPECGAEVVFWEAAVEQEAGKVRSVFPCPGCRALVGKSPPKDSGALKLERSWDTVYDRALGQIVRPARQVPVLINYSVGKRRYEKGPDAEDVALIRCIEESDTPYWFPTDPLPDGEKTRDPLGVGITHAHHFYNRRSLWVLAALWRRGEPRGVAAALLGGFSVGVRMSRFRPALWFDGTSGPMKGLTPGTLYVPSFSGEQNWLNILDSRLSAMVRQSHAMPPCEPAGYVIGTGSGSQWCPSADSMDYAFLDPPFGRNLMYSELNFLWESWLRVFTNNEREAIENKVQGKGLPDYQRLMEQCFREFYRALKPGRWVTVEFHNSRNRVWNAIQEAILRAGFVVGDVRTFDKQQGTFNQVTTTGAVKQDLIISAYKPRTGFERRFLAEGGRPQGAWEFLRQHLAHLPVVSERDGTLEPIAERQHYLLYDRMVAFHVQRGVAVPLSAAECYSGLRDRFVERDGMFFLPDQVPEYDRARLAAERMGQLPLLVSDEKSTIQWLRQRLDPATGGRSQTYQDILPDFLRQLRQARHETLPELSVMLEQGFLQDECGRWYVPDANKASDLERLRRRALLREFQTYLEGRGRLRQFRSEAVRAGFADAWQRRDYATIVRVGRRLPERVLQEDPELLMYYDNASLRVE